MENVKWITETIAEISGAASFRTALVIGTEGPRFDPGGYYSFDWKPCGEGSGSFHFSAKDDSLNNTYNLFLIQ